ncbi:EipB family protein [Pleomorphomonas sp. PLEO]|uniref:cell envelope integrity EipB family protein n=1 Tax=Pleomorphomonas sp. PLEO TaxID=3239306 RepID=UPI00351E5771
MMKLIFRSAMIACAFSALIEPTLAGGLVPHRVAYDLALESNPQMSDLSVNMKGRMVYEFTGNACEGYTVNFRFVLETGDSAGASAVTDLRNKNFESGDGRSFGFQSQTFVNEVQTQDVNGTAVRDGDKVNVKLKLTENTEFTIDKPLMFPTAQLIKTIAEAEKGTTVFSDDIYDGSDGGQHVFHTSTVIGSARTTAPDESEKPIGNMRRWPVTVSYFGAEAGGDQPPDYSISFDLWENGISSRMRLDYGDFVLDGKIVHLELLPETPCNGPSASAVEPSAVAPPADDKSATSGKPANGSQPAAEALPNTEDSAGTAEQKKDDTPATGEAPATQVQPEVKPAN